MTLKSMHYNLALPVSSMVRPAPDFVISQWPDGTVVSRYQELVWDWTPYHPKGKSSPLNFQFWSGKPTLSPTRKAILNEMRWVLHLVIRYSSGKTPAYQTLLHYVKVLREVGRFCETRNVPLPQVLSDQETLQAFVGTLSEWAVKPIASLLSALGVLGPDVVGYQVLGANMHNTLRTLVQRYVADLGQHPPIPTRIFSHILSALDQKMFAFEAVVDQLIELADRCQEDALLGRSRSIQWQRRQKFNWPVTEYAMSFDELLEEYGLYMFFEKMGLNRDVKGLSAAFYQMQTIARLTIQAYSGMRTEEVSSLMFECLETTRHSGQSHYILTAITTKLEGGLPQMARWVTSREGARAVALTRKITLLAHKVASKKSSSLPPLKETPLFSSVVYIGLSGHSPLGRGNRLLPSKLDLSQSPKLRADLQPLITEADLAELEQIDPHRAWRSEAKFQLGRPWNLQSHQFRRSLALYAQRSGLVSLTSLRRQLKHITEEMSRYYSRGSAFAKNFIGNDKRHFGIDYQEAVSVSSALSYISVLKSDAVLFGPQGVWIDKKFRGEKGELTIDRDETIARFKRGELAYRETILGGCMNTGTCDKIPVHWLGTECVKGCKHLLGRMSKLERVIQVQTSFVETLDSHSTTYQAEKADLDLLVEVHNQLLNCPQEAK